jgi:hypothetical protein
MDRAIREIVGVFTDPIIVMPGGWGDTLPEWIKEAITLERLIGNVEALKTGRMTATDAESVAYIYTACLEAPIGHDWTEIYIYLTRKVMERHQPHGKDFNFPEDMKVEKLTRNQQDDLDQLKAWIYDRRVKNRKRLDHEQGKDEKAQEEAKSPAVVQLGFDLR